MAIRLNSPAIRFALPLAMIGMTALGAASPARAEPEAPKVEAPKVEAPKVEILVPDQVVTTDDGSKTVPFEIVNAGDTPATGLVVDFATAAAPIDPRIGFQPPQGCTATGCTVGDLAVGAHKSYTFTVKPTAELPKAGVSFDLSVRDTAAEWRESVTVTVVRGALGVDLETARIPEIKLAAGKSAELPISVRNNGNKATEGVGIALSGQQYINFPNNYSNCVDVKNPAGILCVFDLVLEPGAVFTMAPTTPLTVVADPAAPGPAEYHGGMYAFGIDEETDNADLAAATKAAKQPGTKLELTPAARVFAADRSELNEWDNAISLVVKVALNPADSVAIGDTFEGKIGDISTVKIGFRNSGPATMLARSEEWVHAAKVRTPSGLTLTKVDKRCVPDGDGEPSWGRPGQISGHEYLCVASGRLAPGGQQLFSFTGKIKDGKNEDEGTIRVLGGVQDRHAANNSAKVDVRVKTVARTGVGTGNSTGGSGGGLAITGAPTGRIAGTGLLLVVTGALALVLTRRRPTA